MTNTTTTTLRDRAIAIRETWLAEEVRKQDRGFRGDELASAREKAQGSREFADHLRAELRTLRAMPVDVSDAQVREAMGLKP